jgi:hypothetical protein
MDKKYFENNLSFGQRGQHRLIALMMTLLIPVIGLMSH